MEEKKDNVLKFMKLLLEEKDISLELVKKTELSYAISGFGPIRDSLSIHGYVYYRDLEIWSKSKR